MGQERFENALARSSPSPSREERPPRERRREAKPSKTFFSSGFDPFLLSRGASSSARVEEEATGGHRERKRKEKRRERRGARGQVQRLSGEKKASLPSFAAHFQSTDGASAPLPLSYKLSSPSSVSLFVLLLSRLESKLSEIPSNTSTHSDRDARSPREKVEAKKTEFSVAGRKLFFQSESLIEKGDASSMGDLVVSLPFEAGSFDALNELFGLVSVGGEGWAWKAVARGALGGGQKKKRHAARKRRERRQKKKKN